MFSNNLTLQTTLGKNPFFLSFVKQTRLFDCVVMPHCVPGTVSDTGDRAGNLKHNSSALME